MCIRDRLRDFRSHPVTEEIQEGPSASNKSGTIIGGGNLFSFIGFDNAANPIRPVLFLLDRISLSKTRPRITKTKNRVYLGYKVNIPTNEELAAVSRMPWEPGSWLFKIEKGMSGLGYYLYQRKNIRASRSGTGIQVDGKIRQGMFKRTSYISGLLARFRRNFSQ